MLLDERADRRSQFKQPEGFGEKGTAGHLGRDDPIGVPADQQRWYAKLVGRRCQLMAVAITRMGRLARGVM